MVEPCQPDQFYDVVVDACTLCVDACDPQKVSPLPLNCKQGCAGYYREMMAASTFSITEVSGQHHSVNNELLIAIGISFTCAAALSVAGIVVLVVWRWCRINRTRQQRNSGQESTESRQQRDSAVELALVSTNNDNNRSPNDINDISASLCYRHDSA